MTSGVQVLRANNLPGGGLFYTEGAQSLRCLDLSDVRSRFGVGRLGSVAWSLSTSGVGGYIFDRFICAFSLAVKR